MNPPPPRGFTLLEMAIAFALLGVLAAVGAAAFGGLRHARNEGTARRALIRAAEEALDGAQTGLAPRTPEGITVALHAVPAPEGSSLRFVEAVAGDGTRRETLRGPVPATWTEEAR